MLVVYRRQGLVQPPWIRRLVYRFAPGGLEIQLTMQRVFWPTLFTSRTLQPVHVRPQYNDISVEQAEAPSETALLTAPTSRELALDPYVVNWRSRFDYVLLVGATDLLPQPGLGNDILRRVDGTRDMALFAITR